jgi:hypothetical protein
MVNTAEDFCQLQIEQGNYELAAKSAEQELKLLHPKHPLCVYFVCILMQAYFMEGQQDRADNQFTRCLEIIDFGLGPHHPLHINVYAIMA